MAKTVTKISHQPKLKSKKKVSAYARVSSGKDAMLHSLSAQISHYSELIQKVSDWKYVGVYVDEAVTGTKEKRDDFQRMIADCRDGKIDMIITKSISRFARNTVTLLETVRMLKTMSIDVFFEEQNIHTISADGELMLTILASYAQEESRSASENQKWRIKKNFQEGKPWNGVVLGYQLVDGKFQVVPEEATIVRRIYSEYLEGAGVVLIAKHLTEDGVPTMHGGVWQPHTVSKILRNYSYTGNLLLQKTFRENHITKKKMMNEGQMPRYLAEDTHEPIVDIKTFEAVQAEIELRAEQFAPKSKGKKTYPYTGLIVCAKCKKNYRRKTTQTQVVWICSTYNTMGKKYCTSKQVPETVLDMIVKQVAEDISDIQKIEVDDGNTLRFYLYDGSVVTRTWQDRSRSESWTAEMREQARENRRKRG